MAQTQHGAKSGHGNWHHRKPTSKGGTNDRKNLSYVKPKLHVAWHKLFANLDPKEIARLITETWCDPDYYFVAFHRHRNPKPSVQKVLCEKCSRVCLIPVEKG